LIKPLQIHLEESEIEKRRILRELEWYKEQLKIVRETPIGLGYLSCINMAPHCSFNGSNSRRTVGTVQQSRHVEIPSRDLVSVEVVQELESTVRQLEKENAMLTRCIGRVLLVGVVIIWYRRILINNRCSQIFITLLHPPVLPKRVVITITAMTTNGGIKNM
jgi:hypothetical protein